MSTFLPSVEICLSNGPLLHGNDVIKLKRGQWCHCGTAKGRLLNPATLEVVWRFAGESFKEFNLRFSAAIARTKKKVKARGFKREQFDLFSHLLDKKHEQVNTCNHDFGPIAFIRPSILLFCQKCGAEIAGRTVKDLTPCTDEDRQFIDSLEDLDGDMTWQLSPELIAHQEALQ